MCSSSCRLTRLHKTELPKGVHGERKEASLPWALKALRASKGWWLSYRAKAAPLSTLTASAFAKGSSTFTDCKPLKTKCKEISASSKFCRAFRTPSRAIGEPPRAVNSGSAMNCLAKKAASMPMVAPVRHCKVPTFTSLSASTQSSKNLTVQTTLAGSESVVSAPGPLTTHLYGLFSPREVTIS